MRSDLGHVRESTFFFFLFKIKQSISEASHLFNSAVMSFDQEALGMGWELGLNLAEAV